MIAEILLCAVAAALVLTLLWLLCAQLLLPIRSKNAVLLLRGSGDGETLEQDCRAYLLLRSIGAFARPLCIVDDGLSDEGRKLAEQLLTLDANIHLCRMEDISAYFTT